MALFAVTHQMVVETLCIVFQRRMECFVDGEQDWERMTRVVGHLMWRNYYYTQHREEISDLDFILDVSLDALWLTDLTALSVNETGGSRSGGETVITASKLKSLCSSTTFAGSSWKDCGPHLFMHRHLETQPPMIQKVLCLSVDIDRVHVRGTAGVVSQQHVKMGVHACTINNSEYRMHQLKWQKANVFSIILT